MSTDLEDGVVDYIALAEFRYQIRRFLHFSEQVARDAGVEPQQYQFLLAVKGLPRGVRPRIGELARRMQLQHHSTVELVDRLEKQGFVQRKRSAEDRREVLISPTAKGEKLLKELAMHHIQELRTFAPELANALRKVASRPLARNTSERNAAKKYL